jgi:hypothetical protein
MARHVFLTSPAQWTYRRETEQNGRPAYEYEYDVPASASDYHLRSATAESIVPFQGSFWADTKNFDLLHLEVQAYDIPPQLGIAEADTVLDYSRISVDNDEVLLPLYASLSVVGVDGESNMNRTRLSGCKHYHSESTITFAEPLPATTGESDRISKEPTLPAGSLLEMTLDSALDPATAKLGDAVTATLIRPVKDGDKVLVPQGAAVLGTLVRIEKTSLPFPAYEVGLQFHALKLDGRSIPLVATMEEAGPQAGLLRQSKHFNPTFTKERPSHIDMLVREVQRGQGILEWDARHAQIPRGLRMKWRLQPQP